MLPPTSMLDLFGRRSRHEIDLCKLHVVVGDVLALLTLRHGYCSQSSICLASSEIRFDVDLT